MMRHYSAIAWLAFGLLAALSVAAADCPKINVVTKMASAMKVYLEAQPLDRSSLKKGGALLSKDGKNLSVCLANADFGNEEMANSFVLPLKNKGEFILQVNFSNGSGPVTVGKYNPAAGYGKPFWVSAEIKVLVGEKGTIVMLGVGEGTAEIITMSVNNVCGRFHLQTKAGSPFSSEVAGEFNVKLERSRW